MKKMWLVMILSGLSWGARLKDIATLKGARANQLFGYGIVVGLAGTGDKSNELTESSLGLVLRGLGVDVKNQKMDTKNAAAVIVTATLPPYAKSGTRLDVHVSSVGSASSLESGTLMMSALRGADGKVYAMGSGKILAMKKTAGAGQAGGGGASTAQNLVTGLIPGGATLEREIPQNFSTMKEFRYQLLNPDFTTAVRMARRINEELGGKYANAVDAGTVDVLPPYHYESNPIELLAQIEVIDVEADTRSKVVINPKTGTVVLGDQVRIAPVAIAHGNLKIEITDDRNPAAEPENANANAGEEGDAKKKEHKLVVMKKGASIAEIASSLNEMGANSEDLISLLQALKASGALMAEIEMQ